MEVMKVAAIAAALCLLFMPMILAEDIFSNNLNSIEEITNAGGIVSGSDSFVPGVDGSAINLIDSSSVAFNIPIEENRGTIEFWVKPGFEIKDLPRFSTAGLGEISDFPGLDTFGFWVYKSEYGPVIVLEIKDDEGNYRQAWSKVTGFKASQWHHIALVWNCNNEKIKKNYAQVYIDGVSGSKQKGICSSINFSNKKITLGTNGFYAGRTKSFDKLSIYNNIRSSGEIKKDYKNFKPV